MASGPPLVDGAVVLPKFTKAGPAEPSVGSWLALGAGDEVGQVGLDVGLDRGARPAQTEEPQEFVGDELVVGRGLQGDELAQKGGGRIGPRLAMVAAAGFHAQSLAIFEPERAQLVKARLAHAEPTAGLAGIKGVGVEVREGLADEVGGKAMENLALFILVMQPFGAAKGTPFARRPMTGPLRRPPLRSGLLRGPVMGRLPALLPLPPIRFHFCSVSFHF